MGRSSEKDKRQVVWTLTQYSFLCSCHFTTECFEPDSAIAASVGLKRTVRLKPDAVPSIFKRPHKQSVSHDDDATCSKRIKRYEERERRKVFFILKYLFYNFLARLQVPS